MTKFNEVRRTPDFDKDLRALCRRFRTLEDDLQTFITAQLAAYHKLKMDNGGIVRVDRLGTDEPKIFKARKFACRSLKNKGAMSGIRVIYAYHEKTDMVELIEIYFKGDKDNENKGRILRYLLEERI